MEKIIIKTNNKEEMIDITIKVNSLIKRKEGICNVFAKHTTASIIIQENNDPNICSDVFNCLSKIIPRGKWLHDKIDNNGDAHLKASILGCSINIPIFNGELVLGKWQCLMLVEFDGPREREIVVSFR